MNSRIGICHLSSDIDDLRKLAKTLRQLLGSFGPITRFEPLTERQKFKFLVEYDDPKNLALCVETLQDSLCELGRLSVEELPSEADCSPTVDPTNKGLSFSQLRPTHHTNNSDLRNSYDTSRHGSQAMQSPQSMASLNSSQKATNKQTITAGADFLNGTHFFGYPPKILTSFPPSLNSHKVITAKIFLETFQEYQTPLTMQPKQKPSFYNYLLLKNLNLNTTKLGCVLNLLGSFGNVTNYIIDRKSELGAFGFTSDAKIDVFVNCMQGQLFFGAHLICSRAESATDILQVQNDQPDRFVIGTENLKNHRYQQNLVIKFNPPSKLIHVTNLAEHIDQNGLLQIFSKYHTPTRVIKLRQRSSTASEMFLVEFDQPHKAIEMLSLFHNQNIADRSIKVSFSHTKVDSNGSRLAGDAN